MRTISVQRVGDRRREFQKRGYLSHLRKIIAELRNAMRIPTGYQNATGFHLGVEPAEIEVRLDGPQRFAGLRNRAG
jgi:hypothetical protein